MCFWERSVFLAKRCVSSIAASKQCFGWLQPGTHPSTTSEPGVNPYLLLIMFTWIPSQLMFVFSSVSSIHIRIVPLLSFSGRRTVDVWSRGCARDTLSKDAPRSPMWDVAQHSFNVCICVHTVSQPLLWERA